MQQAELLSSLAVQVNIESTDQSFENAWKVTPFSQVFETFQQGPSPEGFPD